MRVRPLEGSQAAFAVLTVATVQATGCPLLRIPPPVTAIGDLTALNVVSYGWNVSLRNNITNPPLVVRYDSPVAVTLSAEVKRLTGRRSTTVQGTVELSGQGVSAVTVAAVQV
jgi:hypothetical protein